MKRLYKILFLLNFLICISFVFGNSLDTKNLPKWLSVNKWGFVDGNQDYISSKPDYLVSIQRWQTKYEVIISGLNEIARARKSMVSAKPDYLENEITQTTIWSQTFGNISVGGHYGFFSKETGELMDTEIYMSFEEFNKVSYVNGDKSLMYDFFVKEEEIGAESTISTRLEITEKNCTIDCLLKELKNIGFNYEFYFNESEVWFLLEKDKDIANIKKEAAASAAAEEAIRKRAKELGN